MAKKTPQEDIPQPGINRLGKNPAVNPTGRYLICPCSNILHEIRFVPVMDQKGRGYARCACGAEIVLPYLWTETCGYTHAEASKHAERTKGIVAGY